jgi:hypothetical protein
VPGHKRFDNEAFRAVDWVAAVLDRRNGANRSGGIEEIKPKEGTMQLGKWMLVAAIGAGVTATAQAQQIRVLASNPQGSIFYAAASPSER